MKTLYHYLIIAILLTAYLPVLGQVVHVTWDEPTDGELDTKAAARVTTKALRKKADGILIAFYKWDYEMAQPIMILPQGKGKHVDISNCDIFDEEVSTVVVDRKLYDAISRTVQQDVWTTDSLSDLEPFSGYTLVWGNGALHTTKVTTDKCRGFISALEALADNDSTIAEEMSDLRHSLFDSAMSADSMRWIELGHCYGEGDMVIYPYPSLYLDDKGTVELGIQVNEVSTSDDEYSQVLSLLNEKTCHANARNGVVVRVAGGGVIDEYVVDSARIIDFLAAAEKVMSDDTRSDIAEYKDDLISSGKEEKIDVKSNKIVIVHVGHQNRFVAPVQISYERIKPYDDIGIWMNSGLSRYDEKVSKECYDELIDKITKLSFTNPETYQEFNGTFEVKIFDNGTDVFDEIVTVDRLDDFLAMVQGVMERYGENTSSVTLLRKKFSGVLDITFQKLSGIEFPWCFYPINYKILTERAPIHKKVGN